MRTILPRFRRSILVALGFAALPLGTSACGSDSLTGAEQFQLSRARWAERGPASYTVTISRSCECIATGPVDVVVRSGAVVSRRDSRTGVDVPANLVGAYPSVDEMFAAIASGLQTDPKIFDLQFDPVLGYPRRYSFGDPGLDAPVVIVSNFRAE